MRARARKLVIGVALVVAFTLLVLQPFLLPINAQTTTTLPSSGTSVVESKDWAIKPKLVNGLVILDNTNGTINIAINNTQAIATPAPFDQFINISEQELKNAMGASIASNLWSQAMSHHFLNLLFLNSSGKPLYAWVMNYTSSWVAVWVKLPKGIPAHSAVYITLNFTNSIQYPYTGIYSAIYKGYDNGNYTFIQYGFFNNTVPSWWKTGVYAGSFSPTPTTSGLEMVNNAQYEGTYVYASIPNITGNYTVIVSWWYNGGADGIVQELYGNVSKLSEVQSIGSTNGGSTPYAAGGTLAQNEIFSSNAYIKNASTSNTTSFDGQGTYYVTTYFAIQGNTQYYGYANNMAPFQITLPSKFVSFHLVTDRTAPTVFIGAGDGGGTAYIYLDTVIVIPTPPNNVMPSTVIEPAGVTGQYIAWSYTPEGNMLNVTIQIKNYTTGIHGFPGLVVYSANMGNYSNDNSTSGFSAILVSFTGAVAYHSSDANTYTFINTSAFPEPKPPFNMTVTLAKDPFGDTSIFKVYINKTVYVLNISLPLPWSQIGYIGLRVDSDNNFTSTDPAVTAYNTTIGATATTTTTATKTVANTTITTTTTSTVTSTTTTTSTVTSTTTTTSTVTSTTTTTSTVTSTTLVTTTTTTTSTITTAATTVYVTTTITSTVTVKSATSSGLSLSSIYILVAIAVILVAIPAGIMASRSTTQDSGRRYVQKA